MLYNCRVLEHREEGWLALWLIVGASFLVHYLTHGVAFGLGVFYVIFMETFQAGPTEVSVLCSLFSAVFFVSGPVSSLLVNRWGCRPTTIVGGLLGSLGLLLTSYMPETKYLYPTFSILTAFGLGLCLTPAYSILVPCCRQYRTMAMGISSSGVGLGVFTFPVILRTFVRLYGSRGTVLLTAALCLHLVLCGAIFRAGKTSQPSTDRRPEETKFGSRPLSIFKSRPFCVMCVHHAFVGFGQSLVLVHLPPFGGSLGLDDDRAAMLVSALGVSNFIGRFIYPALAQVSARSPFLPYILGLVSSGFLLFFINLFTNFAGMLAFSVLFGLLFAPFGSLYALVLLEVVGDPLFSTGYGYSLVFIALGSLLGASSAGWLYEQTQNYPVSFYLGGSILLTSGLLAIFPWRASQNSRTTTLEIDIQPKDETLCSQEEQREGENTICDNL